MKTSLTKVILYRLDLKDLSQCLIPMCELSFLWVLKIIKNSISRVCFPIPLKESDRYNPPVNQWFAKGWILRDGKRKKKEPVFLGLRRLDCALRTALACLWAMGRRTSHECQIGHCMGLMTLVSYPSSSLPTSNFSHCVGGPFLREQTDILLLAFLFLRTALVKCRLDMDEISVPGATVIHEYWDGPLEMSQRCVFWVGGEWFCEVTGLLLRDCSRIKCPFMI